MAWQTAITADQLILSGSYQTVQESAADLEIQLQPGELAQFLFTFTPQASHTEDCEILIQVSPDGTTWESDGEAARYILEHDNRESDDPVKRSIEVQGVHSARVRARVTDPDGTPGGTDTGSTLDVIARTDGVSA